MNYFPFLKVKVQTKRKRSTVERPCNEDPSYNFHECVESYLYKKRGCQFPWNTYQNLRNVIVCENISQILHALEQSSTNASLGKDRRFWTNYERTLRTNGECPQPCNVTSYEIQYEVKSVIGDKLSIDIAFKNFVFEHRDEFRSCDFSCVIGEVGGNLGFFLGGSLLIIIEFILSFIIPIFHKKVC